MNVFDIIHAARPKVDPMPLVDRRMIREALFGVGHDDNTRSFGARSESGAVVSTAPYGTGLQLRRDPSRVASISKMIAGFTAVATVGAVAWWMLTGGDDAVPEAAVTTTPATAPASTTPPTTEPPFVRTGASRSTPLVLPASLLSVNGASITPAAYGSSTLLLTAPDGSTMWMAEFDGGPANIEGLDIRQVGAVGVGVMESSNAEAVTYQLLTPLWPGGAQRCTRRGAVSTRDRCALRVNVARRERHHRRGPARPASRCSTSAQPRRVSTRSSKFPSLPKHARLVSFRFQTARSPSWCSGDANLRPRRSSTVQHSLTPSQPIRR